MEEVLQQNIALVNQPEMPVPLEKAEQEGVVLPVCDDIPKSFLVCDHPYHRQIVYISQLNTQTLVKRAEKK